MKNDISLSKIDTFLFAKHLAKPLMSLNFLYLYQEFNFLKYVNQTSGLIDEVLFDSVSVLIVRINSQKALGLPFSQCQ